MKAKRDIAVHVAKEKSKNSLQQQNIGRLNKKVFC